MTTNTDEQKKILSSTAVMAAGTIVSRLSGFVRAFLLAAALGNMLHADLFSIANTIPNMLYILLAGGIFNAVLVPQLVRSMKNDADGGDGYANRVITLAGLFLGAVTILLVLAAPWVMSIYLDGRFDSHDLAAQRESVIDFARYCLPQVFFYGMFVLVGQILNARGRFGPMMWAPIANNVISVLVLGLYLLSFGPAEGDERCGGFTSGQELLLGVGSTLGIAAQLLILIPYLRAAGFKYSPRFDFRNTGLGHTLRLGTWTVLFVIVNQLAYTVVVRLASSGTAQAATDACGATTSSSGTGYAVYATAFLIVMVPHSVITVSLATAILPRLSALAAENDLAALGASLGATLRSALAVIVPFAALMPLVAPDIANVISYGAARDTYQLYTLSLAFFGPGILFFTVHYLMLRGFYALERTRTVFWVQCVIAAVNVAAAVLLVAHTDAEHTSPALAAAYGISYAVGSLLSYAVLRRLLGGLDTRRTIRFLVRIVVAAGISTTVAWGLAYLLHSRAEDPSQLVALVVGAAIALVDAAIFLALARALRITEVTAILDTVTRRAPSHRR